MASFSTFGFGNGRNRSPVAVTKKKKKKVSGNSSGTKTTSILTRKGTNVFNINNFKRKQGTKGRVSWNSSVKEKVEALATNVYNASSVNWSSRALRQIRTYENLGWGTLPVCMAKTHLSISHNRTMLGRPSNYTFDVSDVRASAGAVFLYPIAGNILTMPGLPRSPRSLDVNLSGEIIGL